VFSALYCAGRLFFCSGDDQIWSTNIRTMPGREGGTKNPGALQGHRARPADQQGNKTGCFSLFQHCRSYWLIFSLSFRLPVLLMCLASAAAAYFYSAGPRPLGKIGLGQPLVFLFMGMVMTGRLFLCPNPIFYTGYFLTFAAGGMHGHRHSGVQ